MNETSHSLKSTGSGFDGFDGCNMLQQNPENQITQSSVGSGKRTKFAACLVLMLPWK